jgi:hypothetical protein
MKRFALFAALALLATGCSKTVKVCNKLKDVDALPMGGVDICQAKWASMKEKNPERYEKEADCVLAAKDKAEVQKCAQAK